MLIKIPLFLQEIDCWTVPEIRSHWIIMSKNSVWLQNVIKTFFKSFCSVKTEPRINEDQVADRDLDSHMEFSWFQYTAEKMYTCFQRMVLQDKRIWKIIWWNNFETWKSQCQRHKQWFVSMAKIEGPALVRLPMCQLSIFVAFFENMNFTLIRNE